MSSGLYEAGTDPATAPCALNTEIRRLYLRAGRPSLRQITKQAGPGVISHSTVSLVLKGQRVPKLEHALALARALGGDGARVRSLWEAAAAAEWGSASAEPSTLVDERANEPADEQMDEEPTLSATLQDTVRRSARLETLLTDALQRLDSLERDLAVNGGVRLELVHRRGSAGPVQRSPSGPAERSGPALLRKVEPGPGIETLPHQLFRIAHDRSGRRLCESDRLETALATAVIAQLLLDGHVTLQIEGDTVAGFAVAGTPSDRLAQHGLDRLNEVLERGGSWRVTLANWLDGLSDDVVQELTDHLAQSGASWWTVGQRAGRQRLLRPVDEVGSRTPADQLQPRMLAWNTGPDLRTRLLAALTGLLGIWPTGPGDSRAAQSRVSADLLPSPLRELLLEAGARST